MSKFKIISWNVNGIRAVIKKGVFLEFIEKEKPDILCLQETKAKQEQVVIDLPDYTEYWNSAKRPGYSGTAIFTKEKPLSVGFDFASYREEFKELETIKKHGHADDEGRVTAAEFEKFYVVTVYTPNSKDDLSRLEYREKVWDKAFLEYIKELEKKKPVLFCGDLNVAHKEIDLARPKDNEGEHGFTKEERQGFQNFLDAGLIDTFRIFNQEPNQYTWWTNWGGARARNVGWRIDYFLASKSLEKNIKKAFIMPEVMGSDHCPVGVEIEI